MACFFLDRDIVQKTEEYPNHDLHFCTDCKNVDEKIDEPSSPCYVCFPSTLFSGDPSCEWEQHKEESEEESEKESEEK